MGMANIVTDLVVNQQLVHLVDEDDVAAWLTNEGFTIVEKKRIHALVYSHYLIVAERTQGVA